MGFVSIVQILLSDAFVFTRTGNGVIYLKAQPSLDKLQMFNTFIYV